MNFKEGDQIRVRWDLDKEQYPAHAKLMGRTATVMAGSHLSSVGVRFNDNRRTMNLIPHCIEHDAPLSPFEQKVRSYIDRELGR